MDHQVSSPSKGLLSTCLSITFLIFISFILYSLFTFPQNLKQTEALIFQSQPPKDLSKYILPEQTLKNANLLIGGLIQKCQDIQVNKQGIIYCGGFNGSILQINPQKNTIIQLAHLQNNSIYGIRLSRDQKNLYFISVLNGLSKIQISTHKLTHLVSYFQGKFLYALNSIQADPYDQNIIYFDQSFDNFFMDRFHIDLMINRPNGRLFKYLIKQNKTELICTGLHFANGLVYQIYNNEATILVAQANRYRIIRVYLQNDKKGYKQIAIQNLNIYPDNMKLNQHGELLIGSPNIRDNFLYWLDYQPTIRTLVSRLPAWILQIMRNKSIFGGIKIRFNKQQSDNNKIGSYTIQYFLWKPLPNMDFSFATTLIEKNNKLYISSLKSNGILIFDNINKLNTKAQQITTSLQQQKTGEL